MNGTLSGSDKLDIIRSCQGEIHSVKTVAIISFVVDKITMSFNDLSPPKMAVGPSGKGVVKASSGIAAATGTGELVGRRPSSSANSFGFENIASSLQQFQVATEYLFLNFF